MTIIISAIVGIVLLTGILIYDLRIVALKRKGKNMSVFTEDPQLSPKQNAVIREGFLSQVHLMGFKMGVSRNTVEYNDVLTAHSSDIEAVKSLKNGFSAGLSRAKD